MKWIANIKILVTASILWGCTTTKPDLPTTKKVEIDGVENLKEKDVENQIALRPKSWWQFWKPPTYFEAGAIKRDSERILRFYADNGYFNAQVQDSSYSIKDNKAYVRYEVSEDKPTRIIAVDCPDYVDDNIKTGSILILENLKLAEDKMNETLRNSGYPFARAEVLSTVNTEERTANVTCENKGDENKYKFADVEVQGLEVIPKSEVLGILSFPVGEEFSAEKLETSRKRVTDTGAFSRASWNLEKQQNFEVKPVLVLAEERPHQIILGGGGGISNSQQEIHLRAGYQTNQLFSSTHRLNVELRPSYAWSPNSWQSDQKGFGGEFTVNSFDSILGNSTPWNDIGWQNRLRLSRLMEEGFFSRNDMFLSGIVYPTYKKLRMESNFLYERLQFLQLPPEINSCRTECSLFTLTQRFLFDGRDDLMNTRNGLFMAAGFDWTGFHRMSIHRFQRINAEERSYHSFGANTFLQRASIATVINEAGSHVPIVKRLFGGGPQSNRGYGYKRMSPLVESKSRRLPVPVGGYSLWEVNLEARRPIAENIDIVGFTDFGRVSEKTGEFNFDANISPGLGLRVKTPFAPLRLDVGYRLVSEEGLRNEPKFAFHLLVGDAF